MANGRKGQKPSAAPRKRFPVDSEAGGDEGPEGGGGAAGTGPSGDDLVGIVRGLAAAVAEHNLSELVVDTPEVTFTLRRGVAGVQTVVAPAPAMMMPAMPQMTIPAALGMPPPPSHAAALASAAPAYDAAAPAAPVEDKSHVVTSPFVGTFYRRPNPDSAEYVRVNDKVKKGQVLCIVEAMKLMNEIEADIDGTIVGVLAEDQSPVEYGQPLFKIAP
jgi:acetyl-CoA carboxylase biotin carboxyl carrier protein